MVLSNMMIIRIISPIFRVFISKKIIIATISGGRTILKV
jgi:hypothetical protein